MPYFHGTSRKSADDILLNGLLTDEDRGIPQPTEEEFEDIDFPYLWDGVWVTDSIERAREHGSVLLVINSDLIPEDRIYERYEDDGYADICIVGSIAPELIDEG